MASSSIYWADRGSRGQVNRGIFKIKPDGTGFAEVVTTGIGQIGIRGVALDWVAGRLVPAALP